MMTTTSLRTAQALRLLLTAWSMDDDTMSLAHRRWVTPRLADKAWAPTVADCAQASSPGCIWAQQVDGLTDTVAAALAGGATPTTPCREA